MRFIFDFLDKPIIHVQERCNMLNEENKARQNQNLKDSEETESEGSAFLRKRLSAALDSFDNLFCRRCLVCGVGNQFYELRVKTITDIFS